VRHLLETGSVDVSAVLDAPVGAHVAEPRVRLTEFRRERDECLRVDHCVVTFADSVNAK
jgi:hypothetical protein